jgi:ER-bound oxygenase mpaB/B'/Rubber oxygenase, catalytic domain
VTANSEQPGRWTDALLDRMRDTGDPPADAAMAELFRDGDITPVNAVMRHLVANEYPIPECLPPIVREYLSNSAALPAWANADLMKAGDEVFWRFGPDMIVILLCYSLPFCYLGKNGVQVLALTTRLVSDPARRILETAQMMIDLMQPGGLGVEGRGRRSIQKVRLMHAAIRKLAPTAPQWRSSYGTPVNQEDLAGTLMAFSWVALDGLGKLGLELSEADREAYLHKWLVAGDLLGIAADVMPKDTGEAQELVDTIARRQFGPSAQAREMTEALVQMMAHVIPGTLFRNVPALLVRYFLGAEQAAWLGIHEAEWKELAIAPLRFLGREASDVLADSRALSALSQKLGRLLIQGMVYVDRGGNRPAFSIPDRLREP